MTRQIFYISHASPTFGDRGLEGILQILQRNNRRADLTGCLVYTGRHFAQAIEGADDALTETLRRINADSRHGDVRILLDRKVDRRAWPTWSMGSVYELDLADSLDALAQRVEASGDEALDLLCRMRQQPA